MYFEKVLKKFEKYLDPVRKTRKHPLPANAVDLFARQDDNLTEEEQLHVNNFLPEPRSTLIKDEVFTLLLLQLLPQQKIIIIYYIVIMVRNNRNCIDFSMWIYNQLKLIL